jgi:hypothetical protein
MALRDIRDSHGTPWQVFEIRPSNIPRSILDVRGDFADGWLCFLSEHERRRLAVYPADWETMSEGELVALLESPKTLVATPTSSRAAVRDD